MNKELPDLTICIDGQQSFQWTRSHITIGRGPLNDLILDSELVATRLGTVEVYEDGMKLVCESCHHEVVLLREGKEVASCQRDESAEFTLKSGDVMMIGGALELRLTLDHATNPIRWEERQLPLWEEVIGKGEEPFEAHLGRWIADPGFITWMEEILQRLDHRFPDTYQKVTASITTESKDYHRNIFSWTRATSGWEVTSAASTVDPITRLQAAETLDPGHIARHKIVQLRREPSQDVMVIPITDTVTVRAFIALESAALSEEEIEATFALFARWTPLAVVAIERYGHLRTIESLTEENRYFRERERRHYLFKELICESSTMREVYEQLNDQVHLDTPVLISGEAGTGKELLARALHHLGHRRNGMMISLNCPSMPQELVDFELFGCVSNELAGAVAPRKGVFELARGGTVYLEEIDRLSPLIQGKIVRMLKEGEIRRVGDSDGRSVDARLIVSIHHDIEEVMRLGRLRQDLYLLLKENRLSVPSLRQRREDILPLARTFMRLYARRYDRACVGLSDEVAQRLLEHDWPGNVRELQSAVEAAVLESDGKTLTPEHFTI